MCLTSFSAPRCGALRASRLASPSASAPQRRLTPSRADACHSPSLVVVGAALAARRSPRACGQEAAAARLAHCLRLAQVVESRRHQRADDARRRVAVRAAARGVESRRRRRRCARAPLQHCGGHARATQRTTPCTCCARRASRSATCCARRASCGSSRCALASALDELLGVGQPLLLDEGRGVANMEQIDRVGAALPVAHADPDRFVRLARMVTSDSRRAAARRRVDAQAAARRAADCRRCSICRPVRGSMCIASACSSDRLRIRR
jgi:hypothetical protein